MSIAQQTHSLHFPSSPDGGSPKQKWFKHVAWTVGTIVLALVVIGALLQVILNSPRFHIFLIRTVERRASDQLHTTVALQNYAVHLSNLELELYGLTIHGAEPYFNPALLQIAHAKVRLRIVSVLRGKWYLDTIEVDDPVLNIYMDAHGMSNIPSIKSGGSSNTSLFDLGIRHAILSNGKVSYNDKQSLLDADLHDVNFNALYNVAQQSYTGRVSYANGTMRSGELPPVTHDFEVNFTAAPSGFQLTSAKLTSGNSYIVLNATLKAYSHPEVDGNYDALLDGSSLRTLLHNASLPSGFVRVSGNVNYRRVEGQSPLETVSVRGELSSQQLRFQAPSYHASINDILTHYSFQNGDAVINDFRAAALGGQFTASGKMSHVATDSHTDLQAQLRGISLRELKSIFGSTATKDVALRGSLDAKATAAWGKTLDDLVVHADAILKGNAGSKRLDANQAAIPIDGAIHTTYTGRNQEVGFNQSYLRTPQSRLQLDGVVSNHSKVALQFESKDLGELETISEMFRTPAPGQPRPGLSGHALFQGTLSGSTDAPHLVGQLSADSLHVNGSSWRSLRTNVDLSPSSASLQHAYLEPESHGYIRFDTSVGLEKWAVTNRSPIQVELDASQLELAELIKISGSNFPLSGILTAHAKLRGTKLNPIGTGEASVARMKVYDEPVESAQATFSGTGDEVHGDLAAHLPAGTLRGTVSVRPQEKTYVADLTIDGMRLGQIQNFKQKNVNVSGVLGLKAHGQGSFEDPQLNATVQIPRLEIAKQSVNAISLQLNVANHVATAKLTSQAVNASISANAKVNLEGDYLADVSLDTQSIPLQPLFAIYAPSQAASVQGETELHAILRGPWKQKEKLEGHVIIPKLNLSYGSSIQLASVAPIKVDYSGGVITLQRGSIRGTGTDLEFQGSMPLDKTKPTSLTLLGSVDLHLANLVNPDIRSSGKLKFNINSNQSVAGPDVQGQIEIVDASFANGDLPVGLQHGNGMLTLTRSRLNITRFQGVVGSGTVTAQGGVAYQPNVQFDLGMAARDIRVLYPQGVRETINADLRLAGSTENAIVGGQVNLSDLSFTPAFDLNEFIGQFSGEAALPPSPGISENVQLNIGVHSSSELNLVSRTLSVNGSANLQVKGTAAQPVILGRVNLTNGDLIFNGERFVLNGGTIEFVNPTRTEPVVNLALNTTVQQYSIDMKFNGPFDHLRTNYASDPALPAADIINLLAFGKTTEASAANPSTPANQAAESLVASQVTSQITSRVSKAAGISQLSINPVLAGGSSQGPQGANVTIQQRVTGHLFVTFSSNLASTQNQTIQGQYQVSPKVSISATHDQNGGFGFDALIKKSW